MNLNIQRKEGAIVYLCSNEETRRKIVNLDLSNQNNISFISLSELEESMTVENFTKLKQQLLTGIQIENSKKKLYQSPPFIIKVLLDYDFDPQAYKPVQATEIDVNLYIVHSDDELKECLEYFTSNLEVLEMYKDMETSIDRWLDYKRDYLEEE